jgi:MerR family transcriptional regulator, heat shock protein HspR
MDGGRVYRTAEAARLLNVHPQTLRLWERKGVIEPAKRQRGLRIYTEADIRRIREAVIEHPAATFEKGSQS